MKSFFPKTCTLLLFVSLFIPHVLHASEIFSVQAGAFSSKNNAQNVISDLQHHGIQCAIHEQKGLFKIHCGEFSRKSEANALRRKISSLGYDAFVIPKIIKATQDIPKTDIPAEQPKEPVVVNQPAEQPAEEPQPEEPETEQTISSPITPLPGVTQPVQEKPETTTEEQKQEVIPTQQAPILLDRVVAVVNKEVITWSEIYKAMEFEATAQIRNLGEEERKKIIKQSEPSFLESLIDAQLQLQEAQRLGLEVTHKEITETIETIRKKYSMTEDDFAGSLKKEGLSHEGYKKRLSEQILINKVVTHQIRNKIIVSDDLIKKYMEEHKANFSGIEKYKLRQIFFKKPEKAADEKTVDEKAALIIRRLKDGEDFSALAWIYSDDPSRKIGGDLGFVNKDLLAKEFIDVLSDMKIGDYSMPFRTERGLHIIKLDEIIFTQHTDKVKEEVRKKLTEEQFAERYKSWIKGLREKAYIEERL